MYWSVDKNIVTKDLQETNPEFPLGAVILCSLIHVFCVIL